MRRRIRYLIAGYMTLLTQLAGTRMASATFWGGSWPYSSGSNSYQLLYLPYVNQCGSDSHICPYIGSAAGVWNNASAPPNLYSAGSGKFSIGLSSNIPYDGITYIYGNGVPSGPQDCSSTCYGSGNYTSANIYMRYTSMDGYSSSINQSLIAHEMGHVIGLGHADENNPGNCPSIMYHNTVNDSRFRSNPTGYDVWNMNTLYRNTRWSANYSC